MRQLIVVAVLILAAGCSAAPRRSVDRAKLEAIPSAMKGYIDRKHIAGAVTMIVQPEGVVAVQPVGDASLSPRRPMTPDTLFWIASMTKPITATAVMILQDEGRLNVDDPVSKYLPEFADIKLADGSAPKQTLLIRHLMSHTSGVQNPPADPKNANPTLGQTVSAMARRPLMFEPGSQWKYGNGLHVAARIVEVVSGMSYETFLQRRIFDPLGMKDTTFWPSPEQRQRLAVIYKPKDKPGDDLVPTTSNFIQGDETNVRRAPNPSGGLASTAVDLGRFYRMILNGGSLDGRRILSAKAVKQMTTPITGDLQAGFVPGSWWALGWGVVKEPQGVTADLSPGTFGHGGAFGTQVWIDPSRDTAFVLLINRSGFGSSDAADIRGTFQKLATEAVKP